jgi:hypothetical protein
MVVNALFRRERDLNTQVGFSHMSTADPDTEGRNRYLASLQLTTTGENAGTDVSM